jgi:ABC-type branched-subunit amino acid transport system substrate-binding protein
MLRRGLLVAIAALAALGGSAWADPGVTDTEIVIGSFAALEGPASFLGTQTVVGARAFLSAVNDQGGVHGRKIQLVSRNDGYEPDKTIECVNRLIQQDKVFAIGMKATYSPSRHHAFDLVYHTVLRDGEPTVPTDWKLTRT